MLIFVLAYLGGMLTIVSPCILPVLPFVFARADRPFVRSGLPLLLGMAATFALVATLAAVGGGWVVRANDAGRGVALVVLAAFGLMLLFPALADRATRPLVALGARLSEGGAGPSGGGFGASLLLGVATGLLWAPCAGPILGLILTGAALQGASIATSLLLLAYAAGAATSLALALLVGGRVFAAMKRSIAAGEWVRRALGVLVLIGVAIIGLGLDRGVLTRISTAGASTLEQALLDRAGPMKAPATAATGRLASLSGATAWLNSAPIGPDQLRGKVVVIDFWTYSCINCLRTIPHVRALADRYRDKGLVVIGVHTPEFAFERDLGNVRKAVRDLGVTWPVAVDNDRAIWRAFSNQYWPAQYFIDARGVVRGSHFGEGEEEKTEKLIQGLLAEAGARGVPTGVLPVRGGGLGEAPDLDELRSQETYLGHGRAENFAGAGGLQRDRAATYAARRLSLNQWTLAGDWRVEKEAATSQGPGARVLFRFHARDLHLVLGPTAAGRPVRFRIRIDGKPPGADHGMDAAAEGSGVVTSQRLYQLVRQKGPVADRTFEIEFLDPGVQAFSFTFG